MPKIARGTIKSYDSVTNRAGVQLAGSLAVWLEGLAVSAAIEPPEVVAGRECGVLFFTDDDPTDACVVSVHNAVPVGANRLRDADGDTRVEVERTPDEDKIALTVAGTLRYLVQVATPHHDMTGDLRVTGYAAFGAQGNVPTAGVAVRAEDSNSGSSVMDGVKSIVRGASGSTGGLRGVTGESQVQAGAGALAYARGLDFRASHAGSNTVTDLTAMALVVDGTGPTTSRYIISGIMQQMDTTGTTRIGCYLKVASTISATYADYKQYVSDVSLLRATITDMYHYSLVDAVLSLGAAVTTVYGYYSPNLVQGTNKRPFWDGGIGGNKNDTSGNRFRSNTAFGTALTANLFGAGDGVIHVHDAATVPPNNPAAGVIVYATGQDLVIKGSAGHLVTLPATTVPNIVGAKGGNVALANLLTALAAMGLLTDSTT